MNPEETQEYVPVSDFDNLMDLYVSAIKDLTAVREELKTVKKENTRLNRIERRQQKRFRQADSAEKQLGGIE